MENNKILIDMNNWNRISTYKRFLSYDYPYLTFCTAIDISNIYKYSKTNNVSLYGLITWTVLMATNTTEYFRLRIENEKPVLYDSIGVSATMLKGDINYDTSSIIQVNELKEFLNIFESNKKMIYNNEFILHEYRNDVIYVTCVPYINITAMINPMNLNIKDSIPRFCWGKYYKKGNKIFTNISIQVHHSLVDGIHVSYFIENFKKYQNRI